MTSYATKNLGYAVMASALLVGVPPVERNSDRDVEDMGWVVVSEPHVDLWYHGLAIVGLDQDAGLALYSPEYVERVRGAKQALGVYPTELDRIADDLREGFEKDRVFQSLHFLPLFFPTATPDQMLRGMNAVIDDSAVDSGAVTLETDVGLGFVVSAFANQEQRELLGRFIEVLGVEWDVFFQNYWTDSLSIDAALKEEIQNEWDVHAAGPLRDFLNDNDLDSGRIFVSRVMGLEGRSVEENRRRGRENAVVVWAPFEKDANVSVSAAVREMCLPLVDGPVIEAGTRSGQDPQTVASRAAVRCGALLLNQHNPEFVPRYEAAFLTAVGEPPIGDEFSAAFERAYSVAPGVVDALRAKIEPEAIAAARAAPEGPHWWARTSPQVDLWLHGLATIGMVEGDPLPRYSSEYAAEMVSVKQSRGIVATPLDSMAEYFKTEFESKREFRALDQIPLYFQDATPEQMLRALEAVADRQTYRTDVISPEARSGAARTAQLFNNNNLRRVLRRYVDALQQEWEVFYDDYWAESVAADTASREALNDFWQVSVAPGLGDFLESLRLDGGTILVSSAIGPEGRLSIGDPSSREDNVVVAWSPFGSSPREPVYYVIKEICHSVVTSALEDIVDEKEESMPVRATAAVRCGALVIDSHVPILSAGYRRAMMRAVGADTVVSTIRRFEEKFVLEPEILQALREEIGRN